MSKILHIKADNSNVKLDVDLIYPVGSIYMSVNSTSPATLFGGTWEQIKDTFLLGSGSYTLGATGGEKTHTLTIDEMPSHTHQGRISANGYSGWDKVTTPSIGVSIDTSSSLYKSKGTTLNQTDVPTFNNTGSAGNSQPHNNMPPYLVVNIWKRTA